MAQNGRPDVMVYFSQQPASPQTSADLEQWQRVLKFREELPREQLWWSYTTPVEFERLVRAHLEDVIVRRAAQASPASEPSRAGGAVPLRFNLPLVPRLFVGRTRELAALEEALAVAERAVVTPGDHRPGRRGQEPPGRALRLRAPRRVRRRGVDSGRGRRRRRPGRPAAALGEPVDGLSPAECRDLAVARLGRGEERWLLVLDNIDSPAQLADCLPRGGNGRVLVTSRNREVRQFAPALSLDVFDEQTAVEYLTERAERPE